MIYISTRGGSAPRRFEDVLLAGLADDGGLYVPRDWPQFSAGEIAGFADLSYAQVAARVLKAFAGDDLTADEALAMTSEAYASFDTPAVTPLVQLDANRFLLELYRGPTLAFKDVAMQLLARLYDHALAKRGETMTIVAATSGDTGGAAVEAFRGSKHVKIVILFPDGRISPVQRRFMTTPTDANVACLSVKGDFDDCQALVKGLFRDEAFKADVALSGVNSINWARIAAQSVYYFTSAVALGAPHRAPRFVVPTGNFGDAFAGYVAHRLGLPIQSITVATNSNDILARALSTGRYDRGSAAATISPAMDIQVASNFERLFFEASGRDADLTRQSFEAFAATGEMALPQGVRETIRPLFSGVAVNEAQTAAEIVRTLAQTRFLVDPHTAVGLHASRKLSSTGGPIITLSTAHPAKFPESLADIVPHAPAVHERASGLAGLPERMDAIDADPDKIKAYIRQFAGA